MEDQILLLVQDNERLQQIIEMGKISMGQVQGENEMMRHEIGGLQMRIGEVMNMNSHLNNQLHMMNDQATQYNQDPDSTDPPVLSDIINQAQNLQASQSILMEYMDQVKDSFVFTSTEDL